MRDLDRRLHASAALNDALEVARLLAQGANPYALDEGGHTAFNCAASNGLEALAVMTEAAFRDTQRPSRERRWKENDLNTPSGLYGSTLITYAAKVCSAVLVREMLAAGANISIVNGSGWTLLHCAAVMPARGEVLQDLITMFRAQGRESLIAARATHVYKTCYGAHPVVFDKGLTARGLCEARLTQDPACPRELEEYLRYLV